MTLGGPGVSWSHSRPRAGHANRDSRRPMTRHWDTSTVAKPQWRLWTVGFRWFVNAIRAIQLGRWVLGGVRLRLSLASSVVHRY